MWLTTKSDGAELDELNLALVIHTSLTVFQEPRDNKKKDLLQYF
jgi:hypothetical protein